MIRLLRVLLVAMLCAGLLSAQGLSAGASAVSDKQEQARQRFAELHRKMQELQVVLSTTSPDEAKALKLGNRHVQESRIQEDMDGISALLDSQRWDEAIERIGEVRGELQDLLSLLLNKEFDLKKLLEEIERLEAYRDQVDKLIGEQALEKRDAAAAEALEQHLRDLEAAKAKVADVLEQQQKLRGEAAKTGLNAQPKAAGEMAEKQGDLKKQAEDLAEQLEKVQKDAEKLAEPKAADGKPQAGEAKPGEAKPGEAKPGEGKPGEAKDGEPQAGEAKPGSPGACAGSCGGAAKAMGQAQEKLQANKPESSLENQDKAIEKLEEALGDLEKLSEEARRRLLQIPFEQQIRAQEQTKVDTDKLAEDMQAGEQGEAGKPTPGKKNVQQAVPKQKAAAGQLKEHKAGKAKQDQQDAQDELEKAKQELEDALAQLRQELQDQVLRALEERLAAMLAKQREISALTKVTERLKAEAVAAPDMVPASIQERCAVEAKGEQALASESHDALKLLEEDGTTAVFPELFSELERDLGMIGDRLAQFHTGATTQELQRQVEELMSMLLDALKKQIEEGPT